MHHRSTSRRLTYVGRIKSRQQWFAAHRGGTSMFSTGKARALIVAGVLLLAATALVSPTQASSLRNGAVGAQANSGGPGEVLWTYYDTFGKDTDVDGHGDNILTLINPNGSGDTNIGGEGQDTCAMIYVFDADQEMGECCGCPISPAGIETFSVEHDLTHDWAITTPLGLDNGQGSIAIIASGANVGYVPNGPGSNGHFCPDSQTGACYAGCDPTAQPGFSVSSAFNLLGAITHNQEITEGTSTSIFIPGLTQIALFDNGGGDPNNIFYLQSECGALVGNGTGGGICNCPVIPPTPPPTPVPTPTPTPTSLPQRRRRLSRRRVRRRRRRPSPLRRRRPRRRLPPRRLRRPQRRRRP